MFKNDDVVGKIRNVVSNGTKIFKETFESERIKFLNEQLKKLKENNFNLKKENKKLRIQMDNIVRYFDENNQNTIKFLENIHKECNGKETSKK
jgi:predicted transcriptional regulator